MHGLDFYPHGWNLRSKNKVEGFRTKLMTYHDELADLKSYFDGQHHDDVFDQEKLDC